MNLLFVFGTLKQGFRNAHINRGVRIGGCWLTRDPYPLHLVGPWVLPWLLNRPGQGLRVAGELYAVDAAALAAMDRLERIDEPGWYERAPIELIEEGSARTETAAVYFGSEAGFAAGPVHAGPLAEYTLAHQARLPSKLW
jgi:gamma-glutamylaminecyclotransferase